MNSEPMNPSEPIAFEKTPPELVEWARASFDEEAFLTLLRELEATGGLQFEDFIGEIEAKVGSE